MKRKHLLSTAFFLLSWLCGIGNIQAQEPYAVLSDNNTVLTFYYDTQFVARGGMIVSPFSEPNWYDQRESITNVVFDSSFAQCTRLSSTAHWLIGCTNLTTITGIENLKTDNVTDMSYMFSGCSKLTSIDVSGFKTDNVTNMSGMFCGCSSLTSLDVSGFKTDNVTNMSGMFVGCQGITSLDVSSFKTDNVTDMGGMFGNCKALTNLNISGFKTDNVTDMSFMFQMCSSLTSIDVSGFKTDNVTNMSGMFDGSSSLTSIDVSGFKTDNVTNMSHMFSGCSKLTSIDVSGFKTDNVTNMSGMFYRCSRLTSLDVSGFKTDNVTNMGSMFQSCYSLTSLDVSGFKTDNVTIMGTMFYGCSKLTSIDVSGFKTDNVTFMGSMFYGCSSLTSLDVSGFKTDNVTFMGSMFSGCSSLTSLDVSGFKTDNVTDMSYMFSGCSSLTSLDVSGFKTDNVTDMSYMFSGCSSLTSLDVSGFKNYNVKNMRYMFRECSSLTSLDVSGFKTDNVTDMGAMFLNCSGLTSLDLSGFKTDNVTEMGSMFANCSSLTTIYADSEKWNTANVTSSLIMFYGCTNLVGGNGTTYDYSHTDQEYARIDKPGQPGYFTDINDSEPEGDGIAIDATNFPDSNFRNYLLSQSYGSDGILTEKEISKVSIFSLSNKNIQSLKGIEYFTALRDLRCDGNQLATLDVTKNTALDYLSCSDNMLSSLDVTKNTALRMIVCRNNMLSSLDVTKNVALTDLSCEKNQLTTLDLSNNTALTHIHCRDNKLRTLDVSNNLALQWLECNNNQLTSIIVSNSSKLFWLDCSYNNIHGLAMDNLISSLPVAQSGTFTVISYYEDEGNVCTKKQVNAAKQKGWRVMKFDHVDNIYTNVEYDGSDDDLAVGDLFTEQTIEGVTMKFMVTSLDPMECQVGNGTEAAISQSTTGVVTIPSEANGFVVTKIAERSFYGTAIKGITIAETVTTVASMAFGNNANLEEINVEGTNPFDFLIDAFDDVIYTMAVVNVPAPAVQTYQASKVGQSFTNVQASPQTSGNRLVGTLFNDPVWKEHIMTFKVTSTSACQVGNGNSASVYSSAEKIKIPETAKGLTVTAIGSRGFYKCSNLVAVYLTENITEIGDEAFYGCDKLTTLDLPRSVTKISKSAFRKSGLSSGGSGSSGGGSSSGGGVRYHTGQEHLIPEGTNYEQIEPDAEDYAVTREIHILASMTKIGEKRAYSYCHNIVRMYVDDGNKTYDSREDCNAIIRKADNMLLYGCRNTKIPKSVTAINDYAFEGHDKLHTIEIPAKVIYIGQSAFAGCYDLNTVYSYIRNPQRIDDNTFSGETYEEAKLYVPFGKKALYQTTPGWKNFKHIVEMKAPTDIITFADPLVKEICVENWDTDDDGELTETEAKAVTKLDYKFQGKDITSFNELKYFTSLHNLYEMEFYGCYNLSSLTLPQGLVSIGERAIDASSLSNIVIPKSVNSLTTLTSHAFARNNNLLSLSVEDGNQTYDSRDNCNAIIYTQTNKIIIGTKRTVIPSTVHGIGSYAFKGVQHLERITLPNNVKLIEPNAFAECNEIEQVTSYIEAPFAIADNTFEANVYQTATLRVPNGTKELYANTAGWRNFFNIEEMNATVTVTDDEAGEDSGGAIVEIGDDGQCTLVDGILINVDRFVLPIAPYLNPYNVIITIIGDWAFENNDNIHIISIPYTIEYIGNGAFRYCTNLEGIYVNRREPIVLFGADSSSSVKGIKRNADGTYTECPVFEGVDKESCVLYVPRGCSDAYRSAYGWNEFAHIEEFDAVVGIESINNGQRTMDNAVIYNLSGQRLYKPQRGVNIIDGKKAVVR